MKVLARRWWNDSGVDVRPGDRLRITAAGTWTDWTIACGPEGYERASLRWAEPLRRLPAAPWFALVGCIGRREKDGFVVGKGCEITADRGGRLWLWANDVAFMYWNNAGALEATVEVMRGG